MPPAGEAPNMAATSASKPTIFNLKAMVTHQIRAAVNSILQANQPHSINCKTMVNLRVNQPDGRRMSSFQEVGAHEIFQ